ncbi:MAG: radical SAM protein [Actinobacteria bacterium]|nr:radical SAM protein [Actinomycetota bacterium]
MDDLTDKHFVGESEPACGNGFAINRPPLRRLRRFFYRNLGPPKMPLSFSLGCFVVSAFRGRIPFTKYASPGHYTFYIPPFGTEAYRRVMRAGVRRDLHMAGGPAAVTFAVTARCPCSCYHCSAHRRPADGEMDTGLAKDVIRQCADMMVGTIVLTGGEPMMREDLPELISQVGTCDAIPQIFTSGYFLDRERTRELKEAGLKVVFVSLDSPDVEEHDRTRDVEGLFERACEGIRYSVDEGMSVGISTFATHESVARKYHERFFRLGERLGVSELTIFDVTPTGKMLEREDLLLTPEEHRVLSELQEGQYARKSGPKVVTMSYVNETDIIGCFGAKFQLHITHDGFVTPCDFTPLHFGNVKEETLRVIWNRMRVHPEYRKKTVPCRMQDPEFRRRYIHKIPPDVPLPYPMDRIPME